MVNFCKKCGEKIFFTAYFLHLFVVTEVNRGDFFFNAFSVFLQKDISIHGSNLLPPACLQLLIPLGQLSLIAIKFLVKVSKR